MIKKRHWRNKLKELRRQEINHNSKHNTYGKLMNHLNIRTTENQSTTKTHKKNKGRVNMKVMKSKRNKQRRNKMAKMHPCMGFDRFLRVSIDVLMQLSEIVISFPSNRCKYSGIVGLPLLFSSKRNLYFCSRPRNSST